MEINARKREAKLAENKIILGQLEQIQALHDQGLELIMNLQHHGLSYFPYDSICSWNGLLYQDVTNGWKIEVYIYVYMVYRATGILVTVAILSCRHFAVYIYI